MRNFNRLKSFSLTSDFCPLIYLLLFLTSGFCSAQDIAIHHIDVGQGDCIFIQTPGKTILVDVEAEDGAYRVRRKTPWMGRVEE